MYYVLDVMGKTIKEFIVKRDKKYGGDLEFSNYESLEKSFIKKELHPHDLKNAITREINILLKPIRRKFNILDKLAKDAYF